LREQSPVDKRFISAYSSLFAEFINNRMPHFKEHSRVIPLHQSSRACAA
jgi:hypothetical protein